MAKYINMGTIADAGLQIIKTQCDRLSIASADCATYANATAYAVGTLLLATGNFTVGAGDAAGSRKITLAQSTITVGTTSTMTGVALYASGGTLMLYGTCAPTAVTATGTVILAAWDADEIGTIT